MKTNHLIRLYEQDVLSISEKDKKLKHQFIIATFGTNELGHQFVDLFPVVNEFNTEIKVVRKEDYLNR